eukprot:GHVH01000995.1.p2 GENE.GHVH01000995.1~~GHVH01000995.1.p2  ORF type:complete len:103 (-),score=12.15 GHVH01000995.1:61-369(-)
MAFPITMNPPTDDQLPETVSTEKVSTDVKDDILEEETSFSDAHLSVIDQMSLRNGLKQAQLFRAGEMAWSTLNGFTANDLHPGIHKHSGTILSPVRSRLIWK